LNAIEQAKFDRIPKKYQGRVAEVEHDPDNDMGRWWIHLVDDYVAPMRAAAPHTIHEDTWAECMDQLRDCHVEHPKYTFEKQTPPDPPPETVQCTACGGKGGSYRMVQIAGGGDGEAFRKCRECLGRGELEVCKCGGVYYFDHYCGAWVCSKCRDHKGLARCYCGWARNGGDGRRQLEELGEQIEEV
jgi:DNA-directed RNA polymerase subunit M/transcription elongation factor TFIIS